MGKKFWQRALLITLFCLAATGTARATAAMPNTWRQAAKAASMSQPGTVGST